MKKFISFSIVIFCVSILFSSCYCDKTYIGHWDYNDVPVHVVSTHNPHCLMGAIVTHNDASKYIGDSEDYIIANKRTFGDLLITSLTFGIFSPTTTKYYVKSTNDNVKLGSKKVASKSYFGIYNGLVKENIITYKDSICQYVDKKGNRCEWEVNKRGKYCTAHKYMYRKK